MCTDDLRDSREDACADVRGQVVRRVGRGHAVAERPGREEVAKLQEDIIAPQRVKRWESCRASTRKFAILPKRGSPANTTLLGRLRPASLLRVLYRIRDADSLPPKIGPCPVRDEADTLGECGRPSGLMLWFWLGAAVFDTPAAGCAAARPGAEEHAVEVRQDLS